MPVSQRRIDALRARAERGTTEGERNAAQIALDKQLARQREEQAASAPKTPPFFSRKGATTYDVGYRSSSAHDDWASFMRDYGRFVTITHDDRRDAAGFGFTTARAKPPPAEPAAPPKPSQPHGAVPSDFPEIEEAIGNVEDDFVRVEVLSASEMHRRFHLHAPFKLAWGGRVWEVNSVSGYSHDRTQQRYYIHVRRDAMKIVMVTA